MASEKMLEQRMRDLQRESTCCRRARRALVREKTKPVKELVRAAHAGHEGAQKLLDAMRQEMVKRGNDD